MRQNRILLSLLSTLALAVPAFAQSVAYEKFTLDNGLTVILHEDHALPVVHIHSWYYVGAKDEPASRSGFAHLFEHLMFMGTERVPGSQFDQLMEAGGGANNASTDFDRTNYFSWGPAELLPTLLWLDADRLEDLGRMMNQEKLDLQRDVVRNERRQTTENVPYGRSSVKLTALLFPKGHPYHDGVIGSHADLEAATRIVADGAFGCAGQRCLSAPLVIAVGEARKEFTQAVAEEAKNRVVGHRRAGRWQRRWQTGETLRRVAPGAPRTDSDEDRWYRVARRQPRHRKASAGESPRVVRRPARCQKPGQARNRVTTIPSPRSRHATSCAMGSGCPVGARPPGANCVNKLCRYYLTINCQTCCRPVPIILWT